MCKSRTIMLISQGCESTMWKSTWSVPSSICRYHSAALSNVRCHHHHLYRVVLVKGFCKTTPGMYARIYVWMCVWDWLIYKGYHNEHNSFLERKEQKPPISLAKPIGQALKKASQQEKTVGRQGHLTTSKEKRTGPLFQVYWPAIIRTAGAMEGTLNWTEWTGMTGTQVISEVLGLSWFGYFACLSFVDFFFFWEESGR